MRQVTVYMYNYGEKCIPMVGFMLCDIIADDFLMSDTQQHFINICFSTLSKVSACEHFEGKSPLREGLVWIVTIVKSIAPANYYNYANIIQYMT